MAIDDAFLAALNPLDLQQRLGPSWELPIGAGGETLGQLLQHLFAGAGQTMGGGGAGAGGSSSIPLLPDAAQMLALGAPEQPGAPAAPSSSGLTGTVINPHNPGGGIGGSIGDVVKQLGGSGQGQGQSGGYSA